MVNYLHIGAALVLAKLLFDYLSNANGYAPTRVNEVDLYKDGFNYKMRGLLNAGGGAWQLGSDVENQLGGWKPYQGGTYLRYQ